MKSIAISRIALLSAGISAFALPCTAFAAEGADSAGDAQIVVTATRRPVNLQDVPMSVNVATGDQINQFNILDTKDISQLAPGLELNSNDPRKNVTTLRGVTFDPDQGTGPAVRVYYNELNTDAQTVYTAMYDIGQIEVERGPQGLQRGLTAPAGAIAITSARPNFSKPEGYAQVTGTDRAAYNVQAGINLPLSDSVAIRVAGLVDGNRLNNVTDVNRGNERSKSRTESGRITIGWKPSDRFKAYLSYQYLHADATPLPQVVGAGNTPLGQYVALFGSLPSIFATGTPFTPTATRSGPALAASDYGSVSEGAWRVENNTHIISLNADWKLDGSVVTLNVGHQFSKVTTHRDIDAANAIPGYQQNNLVIVPYKIDQQELLWRSDNNSALSWSVGAYHYKQGGVVTNDQNNDIFWYAAAPNAQVNLPCAVAGVAGTPLCSFGFTTFTVPNQNPLLVHVTVPVDTETWSFNANLGYKIGNFRIDGGIRYSLLDGVQTTQESLSGFVNVPTFEVIPANLQHSKNKPVTGGVTLDYTVSPDMNVYFSYGHSFRAGSTGVSVPPGISNDLIRTTPEKTDSYEIGVKGAMMDRKLHYAVTAYYQKYNGYLTRFEGIFYNAPLANPTTGAFGFNYNGNATVKGVEASLDGRINPNWDVALNMSYAHGRYDNAKLPCNDYAHTGVPNQTGAPSINGTGNVSYCLSNGRIAETPDFSMTANTEIRFPHGSWTPFIRALVTYRPGYFSDRAQYQYQDQERVNLFLGLRSADAKWEFNMFAKNLLNQQRISNISLGTASTVASIPGLAAAALSTFDSGYRTVNVTLPREFGASLRFKW